MLSTNQIPTFQKTFAGSSLAALVAASMLWGLSISLLKGLLQIFPPVTELAIALVGSVVFMWSIVLIQHPPIIFNRHLLLYGLLGAIAPGLFLVATNIGLSQTSASNTSFITATETPLIVILAWLLLKEKLNRVRIFLVGLAFVGVILITTFNQSSNGSSLLGDGLVLFGIFLSAIYTTLTKPGVDEFNPLFLTAIQQTVGLITVLVCLPFEFLLSDTTRLTRLSLLDWAGPLFFGVLGLALPYWLYSIGLKNLKANTASFFLSLIPIFGAISAFFILNEHLDIIQWMGAALVLGAVFAMLRTEQNE